MNNEKKEIAWNPWHGCTKISEGCRNCYVYRQDEMYGSAISSNICRKTADFNLPIKKKRNGDYKIESKQVIPTCFTSDFFLNDADLWRDDCWKMIKQRQDCYFYFFTKRIDRFYQCIPDDWQDGYENVAIGCTVENQQAADYRLPIFLQAPIKYRLIIAAPILEQIDLTKYLSSKIQEVSVGGESGGKARICYYDWILNIRSQCIKQNIAFTFHQTGANFVKDGKHYNIRRCYQKQQARKANIDFQPK
ncbi:MAG: DUF5131 family protein [Erysipelotrichia bacterium]|nr:DUF5131 family protein [Erysipelotrichia bacterium]